MKRMIFFAVWILVISSCAKNEVTLETLMNEMTNRENLARFPSPAFTLKQFSSYDRATTQPGDSTWFANWDRSMFIRIEENKDRQEYVMFDAEGPGAVVRFWMTFAGENSGRGIMRIYFDGEDNPTIEGTAFDILSGELLTGFPLAASVSELTRYENRGHNLYLPLPYSRHCKITYESENIKDAGAKTGGEAVYYNINFRTYESGTSVETFTMTKLQQLAPIIDKTNKLFASFNREIPDKNAIVTNAEGLIAPGKPLSVDLSGSRAIRKIVIKIKPEMKLQLFRHIVFEMVFDGQKTVWAPLGDFFGTGYQLRPSDTWYTSVKSDGTFECYWVMPFRKHAEIRLIKFGELETPPVSLEITATQWKWDKRSMYFGSSWHQFTHLQTGERKNNEGGGGCFDINYVSLTGKGIYAGDAIALFNTEYAWWGEGDEKIYVDGEAFPSHIGTGTEDYYGYAWCRPEKFINHPFIAQPDGSGNFWPGYTVNIRQRGLDGIPFNHSIQVDMEMWHWTKATINFAPVTWWYMLPGGLSNINPDREGILAPPAMHRSDIIPPVIVDGVIEGENMKLLNVTGGNISYQNSDRWGWSQNVQLFWTGAKPGDELEMAFQSDIEFDSHVTARFTVAPDYGTVRLTLNGKTIPGIFNLYHNEVITREVYLGRMRILKGENRLTISMINPSGMDDRAFFGLDLLRFNN